MNYLPDMNLANKDSKFLCKDIKIAIVGATPPPYHGVTIMLENVLRSNLQEYFKVIHIDISDHRPVDNVGKLDFTNLYLGVWHILKCAYLLLIKRPNILYVPISQSALGYFRDSIFIFMGIILLEKIIIHLHGGEFDKLYQQTNFIMKLIIKYTLSKVSCVIVLGESLKRIFTNFVPQDRVVVVPNGIEDITEGNLPIVKSDTGGKISVIFLSNLARSKGLIELMNAIPFVIEKNRNVRFTLAGSWRDEDTKKEVLKLIEEKKLRDYVNIPGQVLGKEKANLLMNGDIFVFPPVKPEGQPLVLLEAMSAGLPIITTDQGCIKETVIHGANGFIVETGNIDELARAILQLASDPRLREKMGQESRTRFLKLYRRDIFAQNIKNLFTRVALSDKRSINRITTN